MPFRRNGVADAMMRRQSMSGFMPGLSGPGCSQASGIKAVDCGQIA